MNDSIQVTITFEGEWLEAVQKLATLSDNSFESEVDSLLQMGVRYKGMLAGIVPVEPEVAKRVMDYLLSTKTLADAINHIIED